jgi:hypothetical protein
MQRFPQNGKKVPSYIIIPLLARKNKQKTVFFYTRLAAPAAA